MPDTCQDCGQEVRWVLTEGGRRIELDVDPHPDGNVIPIRVDGGLRARVLTGDHLPAEGDAWRRHSRTCPNGPDARQRAANRAPRCTVCQMRMDPELADLEQWETHPCCDPGAGAARARAALTRKEAS